MKTIQECIKECDRKKIINKYFKAYSENIWFDYQYTSGMTLKEWKEKVRLDLNNLMDLIISVEPESGDDNWILITTHATQQYIYYFSDIRHRSVHKGITHRLISERSLLELPPEQIPDYGFSNSSLELIASFYVADTYLTRHYLDDLLMYFLFGAYSIWTLQEYREEYRPIQDQIIDGNYPGKYDPGFGSEEDHMYGNTDPRQWGVYYRYVDACEEVDKKFRSIEYWILRELILSERGAL